MRLHDLKPAAGSHRDRKRLGRGNASGQGTTAGKGTKGEKARSGGLKAGFRGMSSRNQRMAKRRGFNNRFKVEYHAINVEDLAGFESGATVTIETLRTAGLFKGKDTLPKILGDGDIAVALNVVDVKVSGTARQKIEAAGGSVSGESVPPTSAEEAPKAKGSAANGTRSEPGVIESPEGAASTASVTEPSDPESADEAEDTDGQ